MDAYRKLKDFLNGSLLPAVLDSTCQDCAHYSYFEHGLKVAHRCDTPDAMVCPKIIAALEKTQQTVVCRCGNTATPEGARKFGWTLPTEKGKTGRCHYCSTTDARTN